MRIRFLFVLSILLGSLSGCGNKASEQSQTDYAYFGGNSKNGGIIGRLLLLQSGFTANFSSIKVCIEGDKEGFSNDQLLLETRMAFAAWLYPVINETTWRLIDFSIQTYCPTTDDVNYSSSVIVADKNDLEVHDLQSDYSPLIVECKTNGMQKSCTPSKQVLGWGAPGVVVSKFYQSNPQQWIGVEARKPAFLTLSPYVRWLSLSDDLTVNHQELTGEKRDLLLKTYNELLLQNNAAMKTLAEFVAMLGQKNLKANYGQEFANQAQQFFRSNQTSLHSEIVEKTPAFHTLLHEVGHQMGMDHAHSPTGDSISGNIEQTSGQQNANGQWVTDSAVMAYGEPYLYLTADDFAGIKAMADELTIEFASHK